MVDTPGWPAEITLEDSLEQTKREIQFSASLCRPGPHCFLLAIPAHVPFTDTHRNAVQQHLELLGASVWSHTMVLFTCGDCLWGTAMEQYIESYRPALWWILERCGNRCHILNNTKKDDGCQVTELLENIKDMVALNNGRHYEMDRARLQDIEERREEVEKRAGVRQIRGYKQQFTLKYVIGE